MASNTEALKIADEALDTCSFNYETTPMRHWFNVSLVEKARIAIKVALAEQPSTASMPSEQDFDADAADIVHSAGLDNATINPNATSVSDLLLCGDVSTNTASKAPIEQKDWRKMLTDIGGYENGMIGVPASGVIPMIEEIESLRQTAIQLRQVPQWISVDERLPEGEGKVLTLSIGGRTEIDYASCVRDFHNRSDGSAPYYTHWMPLPAAPLPPNQIAASPEGKV